MSATLISDIPKYLQRKFLSQLTFSGNKYLYDDLDHIITVHNFLNYFSRLHKIGKNALTQKILYIKRCKVINVEEPENDLCIFKKCSMTAMAKMLQTDVETLNKIKDINSTLWKHIMNINNIYSLTTGRFLIKHYSLNNKRIIYPLKDALLVLNNRIKTLGIKKCWIAKKLNITSGYLSSILDGKRSPKNINSIIDKISKLLQ